LQISHIEMHIRFPRINFPFFERNKKGDTFYDLREFKGWSLLNGTKTEIAQNHPILTPGMLFISKIFSQADFYLENKRTKERDYNHWLVKLLNKPNFYQTKSDFLETTLFQQIAEGVAVGWMRGTTGIEEKKVLYTLDVNKIQYPDNFATIYSRFNSENKIKNLKIKYDEGGQDENEIPIGELIFWYDMPNALDTENPFKVKSRLDGLMQTLVNTFDSLVAKNIILKSNGKEMITGNGNGEGFPLLPDDKERAEKVISNEYGLSYSRKRGLVTSANVRWQSLHIALRDLGLDESIKVDSNIVFTALHISKDILSLEAKKTTYNNFKESMTSFIQNEIQPTLNSFLAPFNVYIEDKEWELSGNYNAMPVMQYILLEKYDGIKKKGEALSALRSAGLPDEIALEELGYNKSIKLNELKQLNNGQQETEGENSQTGEEANDGEEEED